MNEPIQEATQGQTESEPVAAGGTNSSENFNDADFKRTVWRALRTVGIAIAAGVPLLG